LIDTLIILDFITPATGLIRLLRLYKQGAALL